MAVPEWVYIPHMASDGSSQQYQRRQRQALSLLVGNNNVMFASAFETLYWAILDLCGEDEP